MVSPAQSQAGLRDCASPALMAGLGELHLHMALCQGLSDTTGTDRAALQAD